MCLIAYHASHEQLPPSQLLKLVQMAERNGFDAIHSSDHFHPWLKSQGQSAFTFSWIAAALQSTSIPFSMVCAPGQRLHPAIVAQAIATIGEMFPGRFHIELASGEAVNELITGEPWPAKAERNERLLECVQVIRQLLKGEMVSNDAWIKVKDARLYTLPDRQPPLYCAALSEETSRWAGSWADGLLTTTGAIEDVRKKMAAFREQAGEDKPVTLQFSFSYHHSKESGIQNAFELWKTTMLPMEKLSDLSTPEAFEEATRSFTLEEFAKSQNVFTNMRAFFEYIDQFKALGANCISLHNLNNYHEDFIKDFGKYKTQ